MMDEMIRTPYGQMPAYVAAPPAAGPWPGVVVVHDFARMSHDLRTQADWLAARDTWPPPPTCTTGEPAALPVDDHARDRGESRADVR